MPHRIEKRGNLVASAVCLALGVVIFLLWLYWEEVAWWIPF